MKILTTIIFLAILTLCASYSEAQSITSIVQVKLQRHDGKTYRSSGFFVGERKVVTNFHVVYGRTTDIVSVYINGKSHLGLVTKISQKYDLALIELGHFPDKKPFKFCDPNTIKPGQRVRLLSKNPGIKIDFMKIKEVTDYWTTLDQRVEPGDSGAPILRGWGEDKCVIGVVVGTMYNQERTVVSPVQFLEEFLNEKLK